MSTSTKVASVNNANGAQKLGSVMEGDTTVAGNLNTVVVKSGDLSSPLPKRRRRITGSRSVRSARSTRHGGGGEDDVSDGLFGIIATAKKGHAMPRALWPVVNLILVELSGGMATRLGAAKVVMEAWKKDRTPMQEVIFV
jgi:hypothetical protein